MNEDFLYWFGVIAIAAIIYVKVSVLCLVKKIIPGIFVIGGVSDETAPAHICTLRISYNFVINFLNLLLPIGTNKNIYMSARSTGSTLEAKEKSFKILSLS